MGSYMLFTGEGSKAGSPSTNGPSPAVATIQDRAITEDEWIQALKKRYGQEMLMTLLNRKAVALEAESRGIDVTQAELEAEIETMSRAYGSKERFFAQMEEQLGIPEEELRTETTYRLLLEKIATADVHIEEQYIDDYLQRHPDQFRPKKQLDLSLIEVASEAEGNAVMDRLEHGEDFADLAAEVSLDEYTRGDGGKIGLVEEDDPFLPPELMEAVLTLEAGDIAGPIRLAENYAIVYVEDILQPPAPSEDSVREAVRKQLALERSVSLSELEERLREKYEARIVAGTATL